MNPDSLSGFFIYNSLVGAPLVGAHSEESQMGDKDRAGTRPAPTSSLGDIVGIFKSIKNLFIIILNISVTSIP